MAKSRARVSKRSDRPTLQRSPPSRRRNDALDRGYEPPRRRAARFTATRGLVTGPERSSRARLQARIEGDLGA